MSRLPELPWILLPGLLCDRESWSPVRSAVRDVSAICPTYPESFAVAEIASTVLEAAPERFVLAGHSMGGYIAFEMLRQAPERCAGLLLISTQAEADTPEQSVARQELACRARREGLDGIAEFMSKLCIPKTSNRATALRRRFAAMAHRYGVDAFAAHQEAIAGRPSSVPDLPGIDIPTVLVGTADDRIVPPHRTFAMTDALPDTHALRLDTGGHLPMWTQSEDCIDAVRLLSDKLKGLTKNN